MTPERLKLEFDFIVGKIGELHRVGKGHGDVHLDNFVLALPTVPTEPEVEDGTQSGDSDATIDLLTCDFKIIDHGRSFDLDKPLDNDHPYDCDVLAVAPDASSIEIDLAIFRLSFETFHAPLSK